MLETMVTDCGVEPWREVQEHANLNYDCHCNRIFLPGSSIHLAPRATPCSDYAAHLSIREEAPALPPAPSAFCLPPPHLSVVERPVFPPPRCLANLASSIGGNHAAMWGRVRSLETGGGIMTLFGA